MTVGTSLKTFYPNEFKKYKQYCKVLQMVDLKWSLHRFADNTRLPKKKPRCKCKVCLRENFEQQSCRKFNRLFKGERKPRNDLTWYTTFKKIKYVASRPRSRKFSLKISVKSDRIVSEYTMLNVWHDQERPLSEQPNHAKDGRTSTRCYPIWLSDA